MAIASVHLFIFIFISLSHFSLSSWSFSHSPSLSWCPTLASNKNEDCRLESRSTPIASLDIVGQVVIPLRQVYDEKKDQLRNSVDDKIKKLHERDEESNYSERHAKAPKIEGQSEGKSLHPASTQQETKDGEKVASGDLGVNVGLEIMEDGEYVLKIKKIIPSSTQENEVERAKQMGQNAALLLIHGEMLQEMGEKLLKQSQTSLRSMLIKKSAPPISEV